MADAATKPVGIMAADVAVCILGMVYVLDENMHVAFRIVLGFALGALVIGLMMLPYVRIPARVAAGVALPFAVSGVTDMMFGKGIGALKEQSDIAWWTIMGAAAIGCVVLHFIPFGDRYASEKEYLPDDDDYEYDEDGDALTDDYNEALDRFTDLVNAIAESGLLDGNTKLLVEYNSAVDEWRTADKRINNYVNRAYNCESVSERNAILLEGSRYLSRLIRTMDDLGSTYEECKRAYREEMGVSAMDMELSFFRGCEDMAQLNKRYKSLAKVYHPDTATGDTDTMAAINKEYEKLKSLLS